MHAGHTHDSAAITLRHHLFGGTLSGKEITLERQIHHVIPERLIDLKERAILRLHDGVIDQHIDPAMLRKKLAEHPVQLGHFGGVHLVNRCLTAQVTNHRRRALRLVVQQDVGDPNISPLGGKPHGNAPTDTFTSASHQRLLPFEQHVHPCRFS